ncbi:hypothetical protein [Streptosporangium sp. NPDC004631]
MINRILDSLLRHATAGACIPPDCEYRGSGALRLVCCYRCDGSLHCTIAG